MQLANLIEGRLVQRYKRFLADIDFGGDIEVVHCPNPGAMTGLKKTGSRVWCSVSDNPNRKLKKTLEIVEADNLLVGVNTNLPNRLVHEALNNKVIPAFSQWPVIEPEHTYQKGTRFDFRLSNPDTGECLYLEVKNVHLNRPDGPNPGAAEFPDSKTARGAKHLEVLANIAANGQNAAMLYVIQRGDGNRFSIAADIDPLYAERFTHARKAGVMMHAWRCAISTSSITLSEPVPIEE